MTGGVSCGSGGGLCLFGCLEGDVVAKCFELALETAGAVFDAALGSVRRRTGARLRQLAVLLEVAKRTPIDFATACEQPRSPQRQGSSPDIRAGFVEVRSPLVPRRLAAQSVRSS